MAKQSTLSQGISLVGHFTRNNLERVGALIDTVNAKTEKPKQFKAVDLEDKDIQQDLFREQTLKTTEQILGPRFAAYGKFAKKIVPSKLSQSAIDGAFGQVAKLASSWSQLDLPNEHRFADISKLTEEERHALATDIANQNRALATLGGISGLAGLPGMLADTLWLLLVSLRTIYQLAAVYDKPLTGKQGIKMAYELLGAADLSKMQEKQALLAGIGVGKGLLDNAQSQGLHNELKNLGLKNQSVNYYAEQIDNIASQVGIDLDSINLTWIRKFLPVTAVIVGMRYNSHLIEEVIGTAKATFGPEPKLAQALITDDSKSEASISDLKNSADKDENKKDQTDSAKAASSDTDTNTDTDKNTEKDSKADQDKEDKSASSSAKADDKKDSNAKADKPDEKKDATDATKAAKQDNEKVDTKDKTDTKNQSSAVK
ncbi:EcsC family protein [Psychrobacter ciconiae]|uniref:EcsC family protein n=1 Tax=Psychrobacter ciconiae TaxID=1553449 RepID=UPI00191B03E4|nr:EcsC family protein [Psychrobacter ciconiae]